MIEQSRLNAAVTLGHVERGVSRWQRLLVKDIGDSFRLELQERRDLM